MGDGGKFQGWPVEDLLTAVAAQDRAAFAELYRRTSAKLYAIVLRILNEPSRTDEAVHDVYVRVWHSAATYDAARGRPITWLATLARNLAIDIRRREGARGSRQVVDIALEDLDVGAAGASPEQLATLRACLDRLDPEQRQLVIAAYLGGESRDDLAARLDRPVGTVKSWLHRSLHSLKVCLGG